MSPGTARSRIKQEQTDDVLMDITSLPTVMRPTPSRSIAPSPTTLSPAPEPTLPSSGEIATPSGDVDMADGGNGAASDDTINGDNTPYVAEDAMQTLGSNSRDLIKAIQKLDALSIDATLPSLPKFIVVGDQSHGKSSIIEAICDIKLPRGPGTCTRCPHQITTLASKSGSTSWTCKVSLHCKYKYSPKASRKRKQYDHWDENEGVLDVIDFATINDKNRLEWVLRRAQIALLNPHRPHTDFLGDAIPNQKNEIGFSPNVVSVEIEGPDLPELSFFDLPGAINVHEDENEQHLVGFIERLMKNYLRDEKALILLACSLDQDVENSTSFNFIRQCTASERTMGVLTKPDLIVRNKFADISRILLGQIFKLGGHWFVTKQLSQEELDTGNISHADARQREQAFFENEPWSTRLAGSQNRFGISNLQTAISEKLKVHILEALPEIVGRVNNRLAQVSATLAEFPDQPLSAAHAVSDEAQKLADLTVGTIKGKGIEKPFISAFRHMIHDMRSQLHAARPKVVFQSPGYVCPLISIDDDESDSTSMPTPSKSRKTNNNQRTPTHVRGGAAETPRGARKTVRAEPTESARPATAHAVFRLDEIRDLLENASGSGIPDQTAPEVIEHLVHLSQAGWKNMANTLLINIQSLLGEMVGQSINDALTVRRQTKLYIRTSECIAGFLRRLLDESRLGVMHIIDYETHRPITHNDYRKLREDVKDSLYRDRLLQRIDEHYDTLQARGAKGILNNQERRKKMDDANLKAALGPDEYNREVEILAAPLTYYDIASAGMVDNIAKLLDYDLLHAFERGVHDALREGLNVTDEQHCASLLAEDPEREALRARLLAERQKLTIALEELKGLPRRNRAL